MSKMHRKEMLLSSRIISILQNMADEKGTSFKKYASDVISARALDYVNQSKAVIEPEQSCNIVRKEVNLKKDIIDRLSTLADEKGVSFKKYASDVISNRVGGNVVIPTSNPEPQKPAKILTKSEPVKQEKPIRKEVLLSTSVLNCLSVMADGAGVCLRVYMERVLSNRVGANIPMAVDKKAERKAKSRAAASGSNKNSPNRRQNDRIQFLAESIARRYDCNIPSMKANMSELVMAISPKLKFHIWRIVDNQIDTEEVLANTIEKIVLKINTYDPFWRFTTWAFKIATNESKLYKTKKKPITPNFDIAETVKSFDVSAENIEGKKNFESLYELADACIKAYPDCVDKLIFIDKDINRMQLKELSEKYSLNENTVKTKLKSMRAKIRKFMISMDSEACRKYETFKNISHEWV